MTVTDAPSLSDRLNAARLTLGTLERESGAAALDGAAIDHSAVNAARAAVDALEQAMLEADRRTNAANAEQLAERRAKAAQEAREGLAAYETATTAAETATKALTSSLGALLAAAKTISKNAIAAGGKPITAVEESEVARTFSRLIVAELVRVGSIGRFGDLKYPSVPHGVAWSEHIEKFIQPAVEAAIERGTAR